MGRGHRAPEVPRVIPGFQGLYFSLNEYQGTSIDKDILEPWLETSESQVAWLKSFGIRQGNPIPTVTDEELWDLYALGRASEIMLLRFQKGRADGTDWQGPLISLSEYTHFMELIGLKVVAETQFSPFYHEIVGVDHDLGTSTTEVIETVWPSLMLGPMVFSRAGVCIAADRSQIRKEVAESSTLYWAFRRENRPFHDLSHGWGSNSQWRTEFRRDYRFGSTLYFNVDAKDDIASWRAYWRKDGVEDDVTDEEYMELIAHRCFVRTTKEHHDRYPYRKRYEAEYPGW
jgi:hypothetical protein